MNTCDCKHVRYCKEDAAQCRHVGDPWCKPDKALAGLTTVPWLTLYHNGSTQPVGQSLWYRVSHGVSVSRTRLRAGCGSGM